MKKLNIASGVLIGLPTLFLFVLSIGYEDYELVFIRHFFVTFILHVLIAAVFLVPFWFWPFKKNVAYSLFFFSCVFFSLMMSENIKTTKELDRMARYIKERALVDALSNEDEASWKMLEDKKYTFKEFGAYVHALEFYRKGLLYSHNEDAMRKSIMNVIDIDWLYSQDTIHSVDQLKQYRTRLEKADYKIYKLQQQAINYYANLLRIFQKSRWKHTSIKKRLLANVEAQTDITLDFCNGFYRNQRAQLFALDELVVFFINRQGMFTYTDGKVHFEFDIDSSKYRALCDDVAYYMDKGAKTIDQFNSDIAAIWQR